nr:hypothetical protein [Tanacetum cinerariifolium]
MPSLFADTHNMVAILEKLDAAEGFAQIIDFLSGSYIHYALTVSPHIYISCIKQFWNSVSVKRSGDVTRLQALVGKKKIVISEDVIREILQLNDAEGMVAAASIPISAAKPKILTITTAPVVLTRKRKGVEELDKENVEVYKNIDWNAALDHVQSKEPQYIKRYHGIKKKPQTESEARKNMIFYLKNTEGFKMEFFKGKNYDEILPIFQARFDANLKFLFKSREEMEKEDEEIIKSINETPAQKATKRRRLHKQAKEDEDLKKQLEVVVDEDDDVFIKATPIGRKVPVVNYKIVIIKNKPRYKIIRVDDTHQLYTSFITLLKNFDREDLEDLWRIVKARFSTSKPTNFSDDYLLSTLKTMFEKTDGQDALWRNQRTVYGQALVKSWKLLTLCGVHIITLTTTTFVLLVEKRYPLSKFTLEQLMNVARLKVEEESEMSFSFDFCVPLDTQDLPR